MDDEFEIMKQHAAYGGLILKDIDPLVVDSFLRQEDVWLSVQERYRD